MPVPDMHVAVADAGRLDAQQDLLALRLGVGVVARFERLAPFDDLHRTHGHTLPLAFRIADHTRSGVAGMSMWRMPNSASASTSAFITDGRAPAQPASPQPLAPSGLVVAGTEWNWCTNAGASSARGIA